MIEIQTTIKNGLPVLAQGEIVGPDPDVGYFHHGIEDLEILWRSGHPCRLAISGAEEARITDELIREWRDA